MRRFLVLGAMLVGILTSCSKDQETCFQVAADVVLVDVPVSFSSCSGSGDVHIWDFGDGSTSNDANPTHTYTQRGTYSVSLTVNVDGETSFTSTSVEVLEKKLVQIEIRAFPPTSPDGLAWDPEATEMEAWPDLQLFFGPTTTDGFDFGSSVNLNVTPSDLPLVWEADVEPVLFTKDTWELVLFDIDSNAIGTYMEGWEFAPLDDTSNPFWFTDADQTAYDIRLLWEAQ